jgi:hypothetical protein
VGSLLTEFAFVLTAVATFHVRGCLSTIRKGTVQEDLVGVDLHRILVLFVVGVRNHDCRMFFDWLLRQTEEKWYDVSQRGSRLAVWHLSYRIESLPSSDLKRVLRSARWSSFLFCEIINVNLSPFQRTRQNQISYPKAADCARTEDSSVFLFETNRGSSKWEGNESSNVLQRDKYESSFSGIPNLTALNADDAVAL